MSERVFEKEKMDPAVVNNGLLDELIARIETNNFRIYFYCPPTNVASGGVAVIFKQAGILKEAGFNVAIIYEPNVDNRASNRESQKQQKQIVIHEKFNTGWLGKDADGIELKVIGDGDIWFNDGTLIRATQLVVNREDIAVIPEGFPNVMEKFAPIVCKKIVLAQSWYFILASLQIGQNWQQFGITDVISISRGITEHINAIMPGINIKNVSQSIDRKLFRKYSAAEKQPKIAFMPGRTQDAVIKTYSVIKAFYCFYPQFKSVRFDELNGLSKTQFAQRLGTSTLCLYTDEIAGFGTMPLEAMAVGTHVVGWMPPGGKEYMTPDNGFWAPNGDVFPLAELLGKAVEKMLAGQLDSPELEKHYEMTLAMYTAEAERNMVTKAFDEIHAERIQELQKLRR